MIDVDVIPCSNSNISWTQIKSTIYAESPQSSEFIDRLTLCDLRSKAAVPANSALACPGYYFLSSNERCTLSLSLDPNHEIEEDRAFIYDHGRNLPEAEVEALFNRWQTDGCWIGSVSSGGGRAIGELEVQFAIAVAMARIVSGWLVVKDSDVFRVPIGIYHPDQL